ncbi:DUF1722 domain-containing protein [Thermodesulfobacterium sp. TA1]|uniref:YbgA family protein n=1 Tax=Thermodesulfobacterium sp. TA1 TaxID=2234087 RepID=UPI001231B463|nr:DUF523 and DUF1722 domain-containing protein [Thermodesulfobacterium sp. TA1]QER41406.1 DUF1722 domain-containing protein [Thermodesulfobacterium sp. TA1]
MSSNYPKPKLVVSACLLGENTRYDGNPIVSPLAKNLSKFCEVIKVCPEVAIGLPVPRDRIIVYQERGKLGVFQPAQKKDLTQEMLNFSREFLEGLKHIDGFLLKSRSPSCGVSGTRWYKDKEGTLPIGRGKGLFAIEAEKLYPDLPIEDEGKLHDAFIRGNFLTKIFALADLREFLTKALSIKDLIGFHQRYKYLLMSCSPEGLKRLGQLVASAKDLSFKQVLQNYQTLFIKALSQPPSKGKETNTLLHVFGHFSSKLKPKEKNHFLWLLERYRKNKIPKTTLIEILRNWAFRFEDLYLINQAFLNPYPLDLE